MDLFHREDPAIRGILCILFIHTDDDGLLYWKPFKGSQLLQPQKLFQCFPWPECCSGPFLLAPGCRCNTVFIRDGPNIGAVSSTCSCFEWANWATGWTPVSHPATRHPVTHLAAVLYVQRWGVCQWGSFPTVSLHIFIESILGVEVKW